MSLSSVTIAEQSFPVYATREEASAYLNLETLWTQQTAEMQNQLLARATRRLDTWNYLGIRTGGDSQATAWPRSDILGVDPNTIPLGIERACIQLAHNFLVFVREETVRVSQAGPLRKEYFSKRQKNVLARRSGGQDVLALVRPFLRQAEALPDATGLEVGDTFKDLQIYGRTFGVG